MEISYVDAQNCRQYPNDTQKALVLSFMNLTELGFYSGDEQLLAGLLDDFCRKNKCQQRGLIDCNSALEISLFLEEHNIALEILHQFMGCGISKFLQFRVLQTIPDEKAYDILASCFDSKKQVSIALDVMYNRLRGPIYVYELGGLGDVIEGFMTIRTLLAQKFFNTKVVYLTTTKMAGFLNRYLSTPQITAASSGALNLNVADPPIHALHFIALSRSKYGLLPRHKECSRLDKLQRKLANTSLSHDVVTLINKEPYVLLNLRSLAKLTPEVSRKSYFLRSIDVTNCYKLIDHYLCLGLVVIDLTEYPRHQKFKESLICHKSYKSIDCMKLEFDDYAILVENSFKTVTIDSMLTHLAAAIGCPHTLLLPKGHDQRWIKNLSSPESMYSVACSTYKQRVLHNWNSLAQYASYG